MFEVLKDTDPKTIAQMNRQSIDQIVSKVTDICHVDYIQYRWTLSKLVELYNANKNNKNDNNLHIVPRKNFVFIIDEINRGEMSKIFGELFFSIDPGYRGEKGKVSTQYQNLIEDGDTFKQGFYIPENVYIIGTMNDIDRSVESMDFAMRRRFSFMEITAEESAENMNLNDDQKSRMKSLNDAIDTIEELNSSYHIGGAYFKDVTDFDKLWKFKLQGLLKEYLRGLPDEKDCLKKLKNAYDNSQKTQSNDDNNDGQ